MRKITAAFCAVALSVTLGACGSANKGGDTTCGDFKNMSSSEKKEVIKALFAEGGKDASNGEILIGVGSATLYCNTVGSDSSPIRDING